MPVFLNGKLTWQVEAFPNSDPKCKILLSSSFSDQELVGHFADVEEGARDAKLDRRSPLSSLVRRAANYTIESDSFRDVRDDQGM